MCLVAASPRWDVLGLERFNEDDLYAHLDWLDEHQRHIEDRLFAASTPSGATGLFLYDVTSSYLEGVCNELAAFGYNRDGKKGQRQIVIGLLCNAQGQPLSIEVFAGHTQDTATMANQIRKVAQRCRRSDSQIGGGAVTLGRHSDSQTGTGGSDPRRRPAIRRASQLDPCHRDESLAPAWMHSALRT